MSAASVLGTLPELAQIGVDVLIGVITAQRALIGDVATDAVACGGHSGGVARPDQAVLFVITEVLGLAAARATLPRDSGFRRCATEHIAHGIVAHLIVEERGAVALPGRRGTCRAQHGIIALLVATGEPVVLR